MRYYLCNAFSLSMLPVAEDGSPLPISLVRIMPVDPANIPDSVESFVGHPDTANVLSHILGFQVPMNRGSIRLKPGDKLYVAQLTGGRLPEGATTLPEGSSFQFLEVTTMPGCTGCGGSDCAMCGITMWTAGGD